MWYVRKPAAAAPRSHCCLLPSVNFHFIFRHHKYWSHKISLLPPSVPPFPEDFIQVRRCVHPKEMNTKASKKCGRSDIWKYFQVYKEAKFKAWTFCTLCSKQVNYTDTMSTGVLLRYLQKCHRKEYDLVLKLDVEKKKKIQKTSETQAKISGFVAYFPSFEKAYTHWVIDTYQPLHSW